MNETLRSPFDSPSLHPVTRSSPVRLILVCQVKANEALVIVKEDVLVIGKQKADVMRPSSLVVLKCPVAVTMSVFGDLWSDAPDD